ncbi:MAG: hypothetical protein R3C59_15340 [Planctomycetaceae bacterium]
MLADIEPKQISSLKQERDLPIWVMALVTAPILLAVNYFGIADWLNLFVLFPAVAIGVGAAAWLNRYRDQRQYARETSPPVQFPDPPQFDPVERADRWKQLIDITQIQSFVLFSFGTCVISVDTPVDPAADAIRLLEQYGPAITGTPSADMLIYFLPDCPDVVVGGYHPNILAYVPAELLPDGPPSFALETTIGYTGRNMRVFDTFAPKVVHVYTAS